MPPRGSVKHAKDFARKARRLDRGAAEPPAAAPRLLRMGRCLPLRGHPHRIEHRPGARGTVWVETHGDEHCCASPAMRRTCRAACTIISSAKRNAISRRRAARAAQSLGVAFRRVSVRDQRSRWGSCSSSGVLSFSWRLILAPPFVLDYLAAHEVAHLVEMNHSRRFWRLVAGDLSGSQPRQGLARRARRRPAPLRRPAALIDTSAPSCPRLSRASTSLNISRARRRGCPAQGRA